MSLVLTLRGDATATVGGWRVGARHAGKNICWTLRPPGGLAHVSVLTAPGQSVWLGEAELYTVPCPPGHGGDRVRLAINAPRAVVVSRPKPEPRPTAPGFEGDDWREQA